LSWLVVGTPPPPSFTVRRADAKQADGVVARQWACKKNGRSTTIRHSTQ
jgi:hypothetical protein